MTSITHLRLGPATINRSFFFLMALAGPLSALAVAPAASADAQTPSASSTATPNIIVVGFVGGFVRNDDDRHPEVQIVQRLSEGNGANFHAATFENRRRAKARREVLRWLDTDGDGHLSAQEKQNARIVLIGHSWGGSAVNKLARDLDRQGIPVLLTIQVDSVNKGWGYDDCIVPDNVAEAANFYQTRGLIHGCRTIRAADPRRTQILGSFDFEYSAQPARCRSYPWFDRHFFKTHNAIDCDPVVWAKVEDDVRTGLQGATRFQEGQPAVISSIATGKQ